MLVSEIVNLARKSELKQLTDSDEAVIGYLYLGLLELHKRFNVATKVEVVKTTTNTTVYNLRSPDILDIISVYGSDGKELMVPYVENSDVHDITMVNYNTFILRCPKDESLVVVYKAAPAMVTSMTDTVDMPYSMLEPLLMYIGYRAYAGLDSNSNTENNVHYMRFERSCDRLAALGFVNEMPMLSRDVARRGFV